MPSEISPRQLARQVADEAQARLQLARERPRLIGKLASVAVAAFVCYVLDPLDMPLLAKIVLGLPAMLLPGICYELFFLRRRLDAAMVLLGIGPQSHR